MKLKIPTRADEQASLFISYGLSAISAMFLIFYDIGWGPIWLLPAVVFFVAALRWSFFGMFEALINNHIEGGE